MNRVFEVNFAGIPVKYQFRNINAARYFAKYISLSKCDTYDIWMSDEEFEFFRNIHPTEITDDYVEYKGLIYLTAKKLLMNQCCIFHAVSFFWKNKTWLLTGKSGVGKTTQYINWDNAYPNEINMISGDMPLLDFREDHILVHPSPWNGKEKMQSSISAPLGGIVILKQNDQNMLEHAEIKDAILSLFKQFAIIPDKEEEIQIIAEMTRRIMEEVPVWEFSNNGSEESTFLLRDMILKHMDKEDQTL